MIISHKHKFIFLKTNKTAGTSIEIALSKFCGPNDVISKITPEDEEIRKNLGYPGPQHHLAPPEDYRFLDVLVLLLRGKRKHRFFSHIPARNIRAYVGQEIWDSYYKFCVERNPWDRAVSYYYWRCQTEPKPTFSEFIESETFLLLKRRGFEVYTIDGQIAVDKICRFENLGEDLESVRMQLGLPEPLNLPRAKSGFRKREDKRNDRDLFSEVDKAKVQDLFSDEIKLLNYTF